MAAQIVLDQVSLTLGRQTVVRQLDLSIAPGQFVALVGASGCGKTSVLRLIAGLQRPTAGAARVGAAAASQQQKRLSFVFQEPRLLPWRNVLHNVQLPVELRGMPSVEAQAAARQALRWTGLADDDHRKYPRMLSGGMQMRTALARSLVIHPEVMLLDEPFAAVDALTREHLNQELLALWQRQGWTAVLVTHSVAEAVFLSQRVLVMGSRPGPLAGEFTVPFRYPRRAELRGQPEFARLAAEVETCLREATSPARTGSQPTQT